MRRLLLPSPCHRARGLRVVDAAPALGKGRSRQAGDAVRPRSRSRPSYSDHIYQSKEVDERRLRRGRGRLWLQLTQRGARRGATAGSRGAPRRRGGAAGCGARAAGDLPAAALAQSAPDQGMFALKYLDYRDWQPGADRMTVQSPSIYVLAPFADRWTVEGSLVYDAMSGASPLFLQHAVGRVGLRRHRLSHCRRRQGHALFRPLCRSASAARVSSRARLHFAVGSRRRPLFDDRQQPSRSPSASRGADDTHQSTNGIAATAGATRSTFSSASRNLSPTRSCSRTSPTRPGTATTPTRTSRSTRGRTSAACLHGSRATTSISRSPTARCSSPTASVRFVRRAVRTRSTSAGRRHCRAAGAHAQPALLHATAARLLVQPAVPARFRRRPELHRRHAAVGVRRIHGGPTAAKVFAEGWSVYAQIPSSTASTRAGARSAPAARASRRSPRAGSRSGSQDVLTRRGSPALSRQDATAAFTRCPYIDSRSARWRRRTSCSWGPPTSDGAACRGARRSTTCCASRASIRATATTASRRASIAPRAAEPVAIDAETAALLRYADQCYRQSGGLFDVTSGVLRRVWDFQARGRRVARCLQRSPTRRAGRLAAVEWNAATSACRVAGMEIDFGGIGKEYAADRVATICLEAGMRHGLVNLGGRRSRAGPAGGRQRRGASASAIRAAEGGAIAYVELADGAVATSGDYERFFEIDGARYCHILDPQRACRSPLAVDERRRAAVRRRGQLRDDRDASGPRGGPIPAAATRRVRCRRRGRKPARIGRESRHLKRQGTHDQVPLLQVLRHTMRGSYWQVVPGETNTWRVMALVWCTPLTV